MTYAVRALVVKQLEFTLAPFDQPGLQFAHDKVPGNVPDFFEGHSGAYDLLVFCGGVEDDFVQHFLKWIELAAHRNCAGNVAVESPDADAEI